MSVKHKKVVDVRLTPMIKPYYIILLGKQIMKKNPIIKDLHTNKYRKRIIPNKKRTLIESYYDTDETYEEQDGTTNQDKQGNKDIQPDHSDR